MSVVPAPPRTVGLTPRMIESLRTELAPTPGRWRRSVFMGLGTMTALMLAWTIQVPTFSAPVVAFFGLLPANVCTWRKLPPRLALTTAGAIVSITVAGVFVQLPWLMLPAFFAGVALIAYFCPVTSGALELLALLYPLCTAFFIGVLDPGGMPTQVGYICVGYGVGIVTATAFSRLAVAEDAAATLAGALATAFADTRSRLAEVTARFAAERFEPIPGESPISSEFARDMPLLERVRQEGRHRDDIAALAIIVVDHALTLTNTMDALARHDVGRTYRRLLTPQLMTLVARLDAGLRGFEQALRDHRPLTATLAMHVDAQWPDYRAAIAALEAQQLTLRRTGALAHVDIAEEANTDAFVRALVDLTESLHTSPADLRQLGIGRAERATVALPGFDPNTARYAVRVGLGTTISYLIGMVADTVELFNVLWHPAFLAVSSYGATIRRAGTRFVGTVIGCLLAIVATIAVMPNLSELPALALMLFAVTVPSAYVALGGPRFSYVGVQIVVAFAIVALAEQAHTDVQPPLWRVYGTLLGTAALFLAFRFVAPDYAGRQLVARFTGIVREMLRLLARPGSVPLTVAEAMAVRQRIVAALPDILRLAEEARAETLTGGVDTQAAVVAAGRGVRIGSRLAAIRRERVANPPPPLSGAMQTAVTNVETTVRAWLEIVLSMLEARHTMARPGSRGYREAWAATAAVAAQLRPDPSAALSALERTIDAARATELAEWPPATRGALVAEIEHLQRIVELLPSFDDYLERTILPRQ
jgi:fusaric acid resistance family protein